MLTRGSQGSGERRRPQESGRRRSVSGPAILSALRWAPSTRPRARGARLSLRRTRPRVGSESPYGLSFSLKFHPAWALRRGPECASTEQFVFHGALASITPLFLRRFLDHSGRPGTPRSWVWECGAQAGHGSLWCPALSTTLSGACSSPELLLLLGGVGDDLIQKQRSPGWLM